MARERRVRRVPTKSSAKVDYRYEDDRSCDGDIGTYDDSSYDDGGYDNEYDDNYSEEADTQYDSDEVDSQYEDDYNEDTQPQSRSPKRPTRRRARVDEEPESRGTPKRRREEVEEPRGRSRRQRVEAEEEEPRKRGASRRKKVEEEEPKTKGKKGKERKSKDTGGKRVVSLDTSEKEKRVDLGKFQIPIKPVIGACVALVVVLSIIVYGLFLGKAEGFSSVLSKAQNHTIGHYRYTFDIVSATEEESTNGILSDGGDAREGLESKEEILSSGQTKGKVSKEWVDEAGVVTDIEGTKLMPNINIVIDGYTESLEPLTGRGTVRANFTKSSKNMITLTDYKIIEGELYFNAQLLKDSLASTNVSFPVSLAETLPNGTNYVKVGSDVKIREFLTNKNVLEFGSADFVNAFTGKINAFIRVLSAYITTLEESDPSIFNTDNDSKYLIINGNTNANALGYTQLLVGKLPTLLDNYNNMLTSSELKIDKEAQQQKTDKLSIGIKTLSDYFTSITPEELKSRGFVAQFRVRSNESDENKGFDSTSEITWRDLDDNSVHRVRLFTEFFDNELPDETDVLEKPKGEIIEWDKYYKGTVKDFPKVMGEYFAKFALQSLQ